MSAKTYELPKKLLFLLVCSSSAFAAEEFRFPEGKSLLVRDRKQHLFVSESCLNRKSGRPCEALAKLKGPRPSLSESELAGGANPGAVICEKIQGNVVIGLDREGNSNAFCRFSDGSLISTGSLHYRFREGDWAGTHENTKAGTVR